MSTPYLIKGFDEVYPRLEIRDLQKKTEQYTLFIFALIEIQKSDYSPKAASFQDLGGIHGLPYQTWSGDPNAPNHGAPEGWGGYCNHKSVLFPSWHRPVVLAIEQSVNAAAVQLAKEWTKGSHVSEEIRQSWEDAAKRLRFPFWDWTDPRGKTEGLPDVLKPQELKLNIPGETKPKVVDNPLATYFFAGGPVPGAQDVEDPESGKVRAHYATWVRTCRRPSNSAMMPSEDYVTINTLLSERLSNLQTKVGQLFCYLAPDDVAKNQRPTIWDEFSNTRPVTDSGWPSQGLGSIEQPHNSVHNIIGGWGTMGDPDYAGFDPIFYLHHCNIDRILAFWEHTYNEYWVGDGYLKKDGDGTIFPFKQPDGTWAQSEEVKITQSSPLAPFRNSSSDYWTASHARFLKDDSAYKFGYTYPAIVEEIDGERRKVSLDDPRPANNKAVNRCKEVLQRHFGLTEPTPGKVDLGDDKNDTYSNYRRFHLSVELVEQAFGGSYSLELVHSGKVVATFDVFARADSTRCAACKAGREEGGFIRGVLDIPNDVVEAVVDKHIVELEVLPIAERLEKIGHLLQKVVLVRLVDVGGGILAYVLGHSAGATGAPPDIGLLAGATGPPLDIDPSADATRPPWYIDPSAGPVGALQGGSLDRAIVPKLELLASRAFKGKADGQITGEIGFHAPEELGKYISHDHHWRVFNV